MDRTHNLLHGSGNGKLAAATGGLLALIIAALGYATYANRASQAIGLQVDVASRQRTLVERLRWQTLEGGLSGEDIDHTVRLLRSITAALLNGGVVPPGAFGTTASPVLEQVVAVPDGAIRDAVLDVRTLSEALIASTEAYRRVGQGAAGNELRQKMLEDEKKALAVARQVIEHIKDVGEAHTATVHQIFLTLLVLIPLAGLLTLVAARRVLARLRRETLRAIQAETEMARQSSRLDAIINNVHAGIITIDSSGVICSFNPAAERIFGYAAAEVIGQNVSLLTPEPYRSQHDAYLQHYLTTGERKIIGIGREVDGLRKDGTPFPVELMVSEMRVDGERMFTGIATDISQRKQTEQERDRFFMLAQDMLCIADVDGFFQKVNPSFTRVLGHAEEELLRRPYFDFIHPDDLQATFARVESLSTGLPVLNFENRYRCQDGSYRTLLWSATPDSADGLVYASARDVTEQRARDRELIAFQETLDQTLDCIFIFDPETLRFSYANRGAMAQVGYSLAELRTMTPLDIKPEFDSEKFRALLAPLIDRRQTTLMFETVHRHKDASLISVEIRIQLVQSGVGARFVAIVRDISERKRTEAALAQKNLEIEVAARIDRIGARVMVALNQQEGTASPEGEVLRVLADEAGYRPLAFYEYDEWQGGLLFSTGLGVPPDYALKQFKTSEGLVGEAATQRTPTFVDGSVNTPFALDTGVGVLGVATLFALPLVHREKLLGVIAGASHTQLTDRERSWLTQVAAQVAVGLHALRQFQELKNLSEQLNERSRKIEAQNRELAQASRLKSEFLASMSHELRTPLNAIIGFSEVLKDGILGELQPQQLDYVTEVFESGRHLLSLINDILDLSKIEAGKMELDVEDVEIASLVDNALTILKERAAQGGVTLTQAIAPELVSMQADGRKLRQIVYNLLSNAVKFTPQGGTVRLEVTPREPDVEFAVVDTGIGIAPDDQQRLFRPFEQLDGGIDRQFEGTGLGLAMVKSLVELHGGTLGVDSEVGKGSRFWVRLPRLKIDAAPARKGGANREPVLPSWHSHAPTILVADDDPAALSLARQWLSRENYRVQLVPDCDQAWALLEPETPDAILLDILFAQGPGGWDFLQRLKRTPAFANIPVVIISIVAEMERGLALGAVEVLQKPVAGADLLRAVESLGLTPGHTGEPVQILVVDDDPRAVEHVARRLEQVGILVTRTYGGADALEAVAAGGFAAVVLDLMMPEVSGFDVLRTLRASPVTATLPVIVLTAKVLDAAERAALENSLTTVLAKGGWDEEVFLQTVREALQPRVQRPVAPARPVPTPPQPALLPVAQHRMLIIDDDQTARDLLRLYLEDAGYTVSVAASAEEALARMAESRPDLITLDLTMPDMDGLTFLTAYAGSEPWRGIPVLVISSAEAPDRALALGAQAVLPKPIRRHEFLDVVRRLLGRTTESRPYVLVVDDDPKVVKMVTSYFAEEPVDVDWAYGGREALESIRARRPDLVLLDLMMPEVSGFDVLAELRGRPETSGLPIVILTAKELTAMERTVLAENAQAVFAKATTSRGNLVEQVRLLLRTGVTTRTQGERA